METFNHHMMALARDSRGITQSGLAEALSVGQGTISKYESGTLEPPSEFIDDLSEVVRYKRDFFFEMGRPYGLPPFHYRKRKKLSTKALRKIIAEINIRRVHLKKLLRSYEKPPNGFIPEIDRDEYIGASRKPFSVEDAARHIREFWMLPDGPIANVVELIEDVGGIIVPCDFGTDLIDAISQRIDGLPVLFFVNINSPSDRLRHTLCHELGHMILHTTSMLDDEVMEHEADVFAGAFLLPAKDIRHQLRVFNLRQIANMKKYWKVSMQSIAMRADRLGLITPYQKKMFFIQISKLGYRKREPHEPPREYPKLINKMINYHLNVLSYSKRELASLLNIDVLEFEAMYSQEMFGPPSEGPNGGRHQHLHVVK